MLQYNVVASTEEGACVAHTAHPELGEAMRGMVAELKRAGYTLDDLPDLTFKVYPEDF
jgi:hypothetical protein